ncbi:ADP-ribosyl cyclase/cyclic ADP-ribose hydrolase 1-like isoform X2 [Centroberyx affinis]|uniref:ADP-ribosyl cyclase/cyclic ADP-ribose hydrolase 1-like isoform X2 n=1 Tax=Centroberyx affinis TaxID=166261 RepID=UPI003A5C693F
MAESFQSVWMALLLASITMMLLQPQQAECGGIFSKPEDPFVEELKANCQRFLKQQKAPEESIKARCDTFWEKFKSAVVQKDPGAVRREHYNALFEAVPIKVEKDKLLLYTGYVPDLKKLTTIIEDKPDTYVYYYQTIYGVVPNGRFCGKEKSNEVFSEDCDSKIPSNMYFAASSAAFARAALGTVTVLMGGERGYNKESIFAQHELPDLKAATGLRLLMVNPGDQNTCNHETLKDLKADLAKLPKLSYECKYIPSKDLEKESPATWWIKAKSG